MTNTYGQKTSYEGCTEEVGLEIRDNQRVSSELPTPLNQKAKSKESTEYLLEEIVDKKNIYEAYKRVKRNKGSHGIDGMRVDELLPYLQKHYSSLVQNLLEGRYKPSPVRRKEIPKPDGGVRLLGIPTVIDRLIQQATAQVLNRIFDKDFSEYSYGFRPNRSAHMALTQSKKYIEEGYNIVVDMDLEKFFDTVNHDILMSILVDRIEDKRVLKLIRAFLNSGIMLSGVVVKKEDGTPQGGPLSPLLSNILLDKLDKELDRRGHRFVRYADDSNIYVKSERAGLRVLSSIIRYLEKSLKLKVNQSKSAVAPVTKRKFLGYSFYFSKGKVRFRTHEKSFKRLKEKLREATNRNKSMNFQYRIKKVNEIIVGWVNYYRLADMKNKLNELDKWLRRRLRACIWKNWKKVKTRYRNLVTLGVPKGKALEHANTRKGYWRIAGSMVLQKTITNQRLTNYGLKTLSSQYEKFRLS